jgi:pimeloyl-ACP methyl ester carboxylesterase
MGSFSACASVQDTIFNMGVSFARSQAGFVSKSIQAGDHNIAYLEREAKGETIVFLHGFAASKDNWLFVTRRLPKTYRVLAIDMPGYGDSSAFSDQSYSAEQITRRLAKAIDELKLERFHLAGNSLGGYIATLYAAQYPDKVITLGLIDSAGVDSPSEFFTLLSKGDNPLVFDTEKGFDRLVNFIFYKKPFMPWPAAAASTRKYLRRSAMNKKLWNDIWDNRKDVADILPKLDMPVLLIWGDKDRVLNVSGVEIYKRYLPKAKSHILKDCGHAPMIERPGETATAYLNFLTSSVKR